MRDFEEGGDDDAIRRCRKRSSVVEALIPGTSWLLLELVEPL